jgi:hypothetical protein
MAIEWGGRSFSYIMGTEWWGGSVSYIMANEWGGDQFPQNGYRVGGGGSVFYITAIERADQFPILWVPSGGAISFLYNGYRVLHPGK